ncbi:MAG TPA: alanyl-tRNA editing protein [Ferrovibrio sp.]|jgi:misacylated tRNA(Ala) deacylase|uniref:alanyl-tRNA editing protein n=1 Tax=Ferrovibrio sp. TaxID=1917215 RepID=UPI002B4B65AE|nr:alanyl-tRNA editing protein [Ferrovibrio sp.]HLT77324.1 alanyl-tRNA editing protein [Ferrovibrio sp.]
MTALLFRDDSYLTHCDAVITAIDERGFQTDRTVFYPLGGGQPGDIGRFVLENGETVEITDTVKGDGPEGVIHKPGHGSAALKIGLHGKLEIDWARRHRLMRMHTCLHLLSALVPFPVTGGQVGDGKGRLDFDMADSIPDKETLTAKLNELIQADHKVTARWITDEELLGNPELVKTMAVKPPMGLGRVRLIEVAGVDRPLDLQACGGTHVARTGEIGPVTVRKVENKGRQNRRVNIEFAA